MQQFDVVAIGDAIIDTFLTINNENEFCTFDKATQHLILHSGEKILVDEAAFLIGGNACNVSVGLKRQGFTTALIAEFGDDEFAAKLQHGLTNEGVSLGFTIATKDTPSTFSVGIHVAGERTLFIHHVQRKHDLPLVGFETKWVYLTSLGKEWETLYANTAAFVQQSKAKLAFNPGSQQLKDGVDKFKEILPLADILFVNRDEGEEMLYGKVKSPQEKEKPEDLLFRLQRMGCKAVCMTDGEKGSFALDEAGKFYSQGIIAPKSFVGKTGAGDAFTSGFLSAILAGLDFQKALLYGAVNAAGVLEHIGAQVGLLTKEQMQERIQGV